MSQKLTHSHRGILTDFEKEPLERVPIPVRDDDLSIRDDTAISGAETWEYGAPETVQSPETFQSPETLQSPETVELGGVSEPSQFAERAVLPHECGACMGPVPHVEGRSPHHRARVCVPAPAAPPVVGVPAPVAPRPTTTIVGMPPVVAPRPTTTTVLGVVPAAPRPTTTIVMGAPAPVIAPRPMTTIVGVPPAVAPAMPTTTVVVPAPAPRPITVPVPVPAPVPAPAPVPMPVPVPVPVPRHGDDDDATKAVPKVVERMPLLKLTEEADAE